VMSIAPSRPAACIEQNKGGTQPSLKSPISTSTMTTLWVLSAV